MFEPKSQHHQRKEIAQSIFSNHRQATHQQKIKPCMFEVFNTQNINCEYHISNIREYHFYKVYKKHTTKQ